MDMVFSGTFSVVNLENGHNQDADRELVFVAYRTYVPALIDPRTLHTVVKIHQKAHQPSIRY